MSFVARLRKLVLYSTPTVRRAVNFLSREVGEYDFRELFRFHKADFYRLATALATPQHMKLYKDGTRPGLTCFLYMLWRAAYPTTLLKDEMLWGDQGNSL